LNAGTAEGEESTGTCGEREMDEDGDGGERVLMEVVRWVQARERERERERERFCSWDEGERFCAGCSRECECWGVDDRERVMKMVRSLGLRRCR